MTCKLCMDCKWFLSRPGDRPGEVQPVCKNAKSIKKIDYVFGQDTYMTCDEARGINRLANQELCGPLGKFYENMPRHV